MSTSTKEILDPIVFFKVENGMEKSSAQAPYLAQVEYNGSVSTDELIAETRKRGCTESELDLRRVIDNADAFCQEQVGKSQRKVHLPFGTVMPHITKAFPNQDSSYDATQHELIARVELTDEFRLATADITPVEDKSGVAALKGPTIYSVCTDGTLFGTIVGTRKFVVAGNTLDLNKTVATDRVTLTNTKTGVVTDVTDYTPSGNGLRLEANLTTALDAGTYVLTIYKTVEGNALSATRKVNVVAA